ncbi:hypothetical protein A1O3_02009 [Capronia epimyces CBS 606.96]|uniref:Aminoglycoside phosphotransferase domain-containing protein n=1 Tax=Capronia epimyces CBS 606.96 TaxID=1182542 RepID=W9YH19_9EURO|nr:uncharacterized protein A1O3_02009 [Capronia epimyces CBS 606.96]EXJ88945.1 hypothetical protein A1O3_02009 [Capronia epimyces CBS 606.96]
MVSPTQADQDELVDAILQELSTTPYAASSLTQLSGGSTNFVFRGILAHPLPLPLPSRSEPEPQPDPTTGKTIIVKHSRDHIRGNKNFPLAVSRCIFEQSMHHALNSFPSPSSNLKVPHHYLFNPRANIQVIEDFPDAVDLKSILVPPSPSPTTEAILTPTVATCIGHDIGVWLRSFHLWASAPAQSALRRELGQNEPMRKLKRLASYDSFINILENFPETLEGIRKPLEEVRETAAREFNKPATDDGGEYWGVIHGDFAACNVLVSDVPSLQTNNPEAPKLVIIDWELAQVGHWAYDLGQMIGDLYEQKHFRQVDSAVWIVRGLVDGYGGLSDELAFRTAIHVGVWLLGWYNRRHPKLPLKGTPEQIAGIVQLATDVILKAWAKDRTWFEASVFAPLFGGTPA